MRTARRSGARKGYGSRGYGGSYSGYGKGGRRVKSRSTYGSYKPPRGRMPRKLRALLCGLAALAALVLGALSLLTRQPPARLDTELMVKFVDVGQGDACLLVCGGEAMLVDGGTADGGANLGQELRDMGILRLKYVVNTHPHDDHVGGLCAPVAEMSVGAAYSSAVDYDQNYFARFKRLLKQRGVELGTLEAGDELKLGGARVHVLAPREDLNDINENSIVLRVVHGGNTFLLTGDAGKPEERTMLAARAPLDSDVLKVGHHGSNGSSCEEFLEAVSPDWAVISLGADNDFGHPHDEVLDRLADVGARVLRTDRNGDITMVSDGRDLMVTAERGFEDAGGDVREEEYYIGNRQSRKFHVPGCASLPAERNRVTFDTRADAVAAGYTPCGSCMP